MAGHARNAAIGVFDPGVGGPAAARARPDQPLPHVGDTAHRPLPLAAMAALDRDPKAPPVRRVSATVGPEPFGRRRLGPATVTTLGAA